jgi:outer membrane protein assembly factor BamB
MRWIDHRLTAIVLLSAITSLVAPGAAQDWMEWRGPNRDGTVPSFTAPQSLPEKLTEHWKVEVGLGYATPLIVGNRIYMFSRKGEDEVMQAMTLTTGEILWQTTYPAVFTMNRSAAGHGPGPKSTPVYRDGKLFTIGMTGAVTAFDAASGKILWQKPGSEPLLYYTTHSFSPVIEQGAVIFHVGGHNVGALTAFDVDTGDVKWRWDGDAPAYGSPIVTVLDGTRQIVTNSQGKVVGLDVFTGKLLWEYPYVSSNFTNSMTPLRYEDLFIISSREKPVTAIRAKKEAKHWSVEKVWENEGVTMRMTNGVIVQDRLFGLSTRNSGQYFSLNPRTGETVWLSAPRQAENASLLRVGLRTGNWVLSLEDDGELIVFRRNQEAFEEVRRYKVAETDTWTQPVFSGNRILVKDVSTLSLLTWN